MQFIRRALYPALQAPDSVPFRSQDLRQDAFDDNNEHNDAAGLRAMRTLLEWRR